MVLTDIRFNLKYRSDNDQLHEDFYYPCLVESLKYDRAAGYFSSHSLKTLARGFEVFLFNGGKIRIVANPMLSAEDILAIEKGYKAKHDVIERALLREIEVSSATLQDETLNVLAWLIYKDQLEIKIAHTDNNAIYHEKFGVFTDEEGNSVAFSGSANETFGGIVSNFEKIDVYSGVQDQRRIQGAKEDFELLWSNNTNGLSVIDVPASVKNNLLEKRGPMPKPSQCVVTIEPRKYQQNAIQMLKNNNWQGILEMAMGTGKTITSLLAVTEYKKINGRLFLVIYAPFTHLVEQWKQECEKFGFEYITLCYDSKKKWLDELEKEIRNFNIGILNVHVVITTYKTAATPHFNALINKVAHHSVLIADECHYIGSCAFRNIEFQNFTAKIGLSATPDRWWDETGTAFLKEIFDKVVYQYSLEAAIGSGKLTPYEYFPHVISLTESEIEAYKKLTLQIIRLYNSEDADKEKIEQLNRKRSLILAKASGKIPLLLSLLKKRNVEVIQHTLIYCAERQVSVLTKALSDMGLRVHKFDSTVANKERKKVLEAFADGTIQVLVAIKCLDEGVDVPSTRSAYFLASTSNPREFVQRRGRILRTAKGKTLAEIHDFIVFPDGIDADTFTMIVKKELPRFAEFSGAAINQSTAKNEIYPYLDPYNLNYLMDMKPWDVYYKMKEAYEDGVFE
ncbi:DEAD/DEAH box helicase family protein [Bacillus cereus group sp. Bc010]|uniref:DEAD/DEAH box helicase family protein n=1 Tax=Bacillus cereus group sp. Bc010 TaxID=3018125 RepID=UPI0022E88529|nr:DEAD/DEAH box helicase family protein [Bacillus cereus group sp. Bc010]MDA2771325.1 DEAD/DEAH box helicase family protein [Bacillus cereus group sp. Bc010]